MSGVFYDLHTHALSGIDDGAKDVSVALQMLRQSHAQGVAMTALTPHCTLHREGSLERFLLRRQKAYQALLDAAEEDCSGELPHLLLGAEIYADHDLSREANIERLCLEGTDLLLMEFAFGDKTPWLSECVYALNRKGITPMIAHVDRYPQREQIFADLEGLSVIYQLNTSCFLSLTGRMIFKRILRHGGTFVVSSDMHNLTDRVCDMEKAYAVCKRKYAKEADEWFCTNAERLLNIRHEP